MHRTVRRPWPLHKHPPHAAPTMATCTHYRIPPEWTQTFLTKPQPPCLFLLILFNKDVSLEGETKKQNQSNKEAGHSLLVTGGSPTGVGQGETPPPPGPWGPNSIIIPLPPGIRGGLRLSQGTVGSGHMAQACEDSRGVGLSASLSSCSECGGGISLTLTS